jgi:hypothetical protein
MVQEKEMTNHNKYKYNLETFTKEDDISYYLLGAFITDGCVSYNTSHSPDKKYYSCELKSADHDWLQTISKLCGDDLLLKKASNSQCLRLRIHNTKIAEWLISYNCVPNKTLTVKFPNIPEKYLSDFIRGCWDGDGSISNIKRKNGYLEPKAQLYSASKSFIYDLQKTLLQKYKIISHIYEVKMTDHKMLDGTVITAKNQLYQMSIGSRHCKKFCQEIYYVDHKISMPRKNKKAQEIID